jgi:hypothetical protein
MGARPHASYRLAWSTKKANHHTRSAQPPCGYTPLHLRSNQRLGRRTTAQGACNRPAAKRSLVFAKTSGQEGEPPHKEHVTAPRLSAPSSSPKPVVKNRTAAIRQCHASSGTVVEDWKDKFSEPVQQLEAPRAWLNSDIKYKGHGPVSRGNECDNRRSHRQADSNCTNRSAEAVGRSPIKLWPHLQARILPWGGPGGHCQYPWSGVPSPTAWRRRIRTTPQGHVKNGAQPHHIGQVQGHHVARKGGASQSSPMGLDLRRTPDPYTYKPRASKKACQVPWEGSSPPPSKVRALARSRDGKDPGMRGVRCWHVSRPCPALPATSARLAT